MAHLTDRIRDLAEEIEFNWLEFRWRMQGNLIRAGVPALVAGVPAHRIPHLIGVAEYVYKVRATDMAWLCGPAGLLDLLIEAEAWARKDWLD